MKNWRKICKGADTNAWLFLALLTYKKDFVHMSDDYLIINSS